MNPEWCSLCIKQNRAPEVIRKETRRPAEKKEQTTFGLSAMTAEDLSLSGWTVVHTIHARKTPQLLSLGDATHVHIDGFPYLWLIEKILAGAPSLKKIQVIPSTYGHLREKTHLRLCSERGVEIVKGHVRPEMAWEGGRNVSRFYEGQRSFLLNLKDEQKALWDELLAMNFEIAEMAARYFCLNGEPFFSMRIIGEEYGIIHSAGMIASRKINAVIAYLDPSFETANDSKQIARALKPKVERLRKYLSAAAAQQVLAQELGLEKLPDHLAISRFELFKKVLAAWRAGKFRFLDDEREMIILESRFGLISGKCLTLQEIGDEMKLTRERIRQLQDIALEKIGIVVEEDE